MIKGNKKKIIDFLLDKPIEKQYEIKEYREKRSLSQNAYAWKLITEIGNVLHKSKEEIYLQMLKDYGQVSEISMLASVNPNGYFKYYDLIQRRVFNGKEFNILKLYKGSSEFDSKEMSIFIDGIIQECKQLDIETMTPEEIAQLDLI